MILNIKKRTEEDIKLNSLTHTTNASGWQNGVNITMETKIKDCEVNNRENKGCCVKVKRADYLIYLNKYHPIVIVVAMDNNKTISYGMQQAMEYAQIHDFSFAYRSCGDGFYKHTFRPTWSARYSYIKENY